MSSTDAPRKLMIFADGTAMVGGMRPEENTSNIYKLYLACRTGHQSPVPRTGQIAFYHAGLGAKVDSGVVPNPFSVFRRITNLAMGAGITEHIVDCYETILRHYKPGDRIYLIGFSRGAYTVRNVANVLSLCGIPEHNGKPERNGKVDKDSADIKDKDYARRGSEPRKIAIEAVNIYEHGAGKDRDLYRPERRERARRFREKYGSWANRGANDETEDKSQSNVTPYFIGVFDAVAALGVGGIKRLLVLFFACIGLLVATVLGGEFLSEMLEISDGAGNTSAFVLIVSAIILKFGLSRLRVITRYPEKDKPSLYWETGKWLPKINFKWHIVSWRFKHFDRYLDQRVPYARHAISIDERRADFDRVRWGIKGERLDSSTDGKKDSPEWFKQVWFAGDHTNVGGGHPHQESGLSDITMQWMVDQMENVPDSPIFDKSRLHCDPDPLAPQHCSVKSLQYKYPSWWPKSKRFTWPSINREVQPDAPLPDAQLHPSVLRRYKAEKVLQEGVYKAYRPVNLEKHQKIIELKSLNRLV